VEGYINVENELERISKQPWRITELKSDSARRVVAWVAPAAANLRNQRKRIADMRMAARGSENGTIVERWTEYDLVFPAANGNPLDGTNVYHELQDLLTGACLLRWRVHDLRHGSATYLLAAWRQPAGGDGDHGLVADQHVEALPARAGQDAKGLRSAPRRPPRTPRHLRGSRGPNVVKHWWLTTPPTDLTCTATSR
jgi:hypothetical protein